MQKVVSSPAKPQHALHGHERDEDRDQNPGDNQNDLATHPALALCWSAIATGSLLGISSWAALYTLGAAMAVTLSHGSLPSTGIRLGIFGMYAAVSASSALALGSYTAAMASGARTRRQAWLHGAAMWSMSTITLVAVACFALSGSFAKLTYASAPIMAVGLAALGLQLEGPNASLGVILWCMVGTLGLSLFLALWGAGCSTAHRHQNEPYNANT